MNALLRARPIDPENSFFKVNPGLSKREALDEASVILAGLSDILISLVEGSPMDGNGYHALPIVEFRSRRNLTTHLKRKMRTLVQRLEREGLA